MKDFEIRLAEAARAAGALSAAALRMDRPDLLRSVRAHAGRVASWLAEGRHGEMVYLKRTLPLRSAPGEAFPFARSVVVATFEGDWRAGAPSPFPVPDPGAPLVGYVSAYASGVDYHERGHRMLATMAKELGLTGRVETEVDTGAVFERLLAMRAGLGRIGENGLLRTSERGTRVFLGFLFAEEVLPEVVRSPEMPFDCADCSACLENCPTGALKAGRTFDARRCVSYLTIEKRGLLSSVEERAIGRWIFGCDDCTSVCPPVWRDGRMAVDLGWLLKAPSGEVRRRLEGTAMAYAGVGRLRRNAVAVLKGMDAPEAKALLAWTRANAGSARVRAQCEVSGEPSVGNEKGDGANAGGEKQG